MLRFEEDEEIKFREMLQFKAKKEIKQFKVYLSEHLGRHQLKWNYLLEFKPKTAIPDIYSK